MAKFLLKMLDKMRARTRAKLMFEVQHLGRMLVQSETLKFSDGLHLVIGAPSNDMKRLIALSSMRIRSVC